MSDSPESTHHGLHELVIEIVGLKATLLRSGRLLGEIALMPTVLLTVLLHVIGLRPALLVAIGWIFLVLAVRWVRDRHLPGTMLLCAGMFSGRVAVAMAAGSAFVYLLQPVLASVLMAAMFLGSAAFGKPITVRLARDFVHVPGHVLDRVAVKRMFKQVALLWGASRLLDAVMSVGFLHFGVDAGLLSRALLSPVLTLLAVGACSFWGWRALRNDGVSLRLVPARAIA